MPLPLKRPTTPSSRQIRTKVWERVSKPLPFSTTPDLLFCTYKSITISKGFWMRATWNRILARSSGLTTVRETAPAMPPATNDAENTVECEAVLEGASGRLEVSRGCSITFAKQVLNFDLALRVCLPSQPTGVLVWMMRRLPLAFAVILGDYRL